MIRLNVVLLGVPPSRLVVMAAAVAVHSEWGNQGSYVTHIERRVGYQDSDLRTDDLDFRQEVFWGSIWKSMWRCGAWKRFCSSADCAYENVIDRLPSPGFNV